MSTNVSLASNRRSSFRAEVICALFLALITNGCGGGDGRMVHSDGAKLYIEAMKVRTQDEQQCLDLLEQSIADTPTGSAYFHRAWIFAKRENLDEAQANLKLGLELEPESTDLQWLAAELEKPEKKRNLKAPPTASK